MKFAPLLFILQMSVGMDVLYIGMSVRCIGMLSFLFSVTSYDLINWLYLHKLISSFIFLMVNLSFVERCDEMDNLHVPADVGAIESPYKGMLLTPLSVNRITVPLLC